MSFSRYLHENRGQFIDHREPPPPAVDVPIDDLDGEPLQRARGSGSSSRRRASQRPTLRYRHVKPAFSRSIWIDPLPYEEPEDRARRFNA